MRLSAAKYTLSEFKEKDAAALAALEGVCFSTSWSAERYAECFRLAAARPEQPPFAAFGLVVKAETPAAYICLALHHSAGEAEIYNIAVAPSLRRQGLGGILLGHALGRMAHFGLHRVFLEVRTGNVPALALYAGEGFAVCGRRKKYYADTGEDALVLVCDLSARRLIRRQNAGG